MIIERPDVDVVYGHSALVNEDGLILHMMWAPAFSARLLPLHTFFSQPSAFIRRRAIADQFVDEDFDHAMDRELWLRLAWQRRFARLDRVVAIDRHQRGRKGYVQPEVARQENSRLAEMYCLPYGQWADVRRKVFKVLARWRGIALIGQAGPPHSFQAISDGRLRLLLRQAVTLRRWMPASAPGS